MLHSIALLSEYYNIEYGISELMLKLQSIFLKLEKLMSKAIHFLRPHTQGYGSMNDTHVKLCQSIGKHLLIICPN